MAFSSTPKLLPAPVGTDRVMDGDDAMRRLAQAVDNMVQVGTASVNIVTGGTAASVTVTFPVPFASTPTCVACPIATTAVAGMGATIAAQSATQLTISAVRPATGNFNILWIAVGPVNPVP